MSDSYYTSNVAGSGGEDRVAAMSVNNIPALRRAVENGIGTGVQPEYLNEPELSPVQSMTPAVTRALDCYLVYSEATKNVARLRVFRDFLVASAQRGNIEQRPNQTYSCQLHVH